MLIVTFCLVSFSCLGPLFAAKHVFYFFLIFFTNFVTSDSVKDNSGQFVPAILCPQKTAFIKKTSLRSKCHRVPETVIADW